MKEEQNRAEQIRTSDRHHTRVDRQADRYTAQTDRLPDRLTDLTDLFGTSLGWTADVEPDILETAALQTCLPSHTH